MKTPREIAASICIGGHVMHLGKCWLVTDIYRSVFTGLVEKLDLRLTIIVNPKKRFLDECITKRAVPISLVSPADQS
jgi:hypothetical protein